MTVARIAQGKGVHAVPILTRGLSDQVWVQSGEARKVDGCYFQVVGGVEKVKGVRNLVDWSGSELHLLNTRIDAITSYRVRNGPEELVLSLSGDTGAAHMFYNNADPGILFDKDGNTRQKYIGARILVLRNDRLEHPALPHIGMGSPWDDRFADDKGGAQVIAFGRVESEDQSQGDFFATWAGRLFAVNGVDENIKWNGSYASNVGVHEKPAPPTAKSYVNTKFHADYSIGEEFNGAGEADRGNLGNTEQRFQYRATFVSHSGAEGPPSEPGDFAVTGKTYLNATWDEKSKNWYTKPRPIDSATGDPVVTWTDKEDFLLTTNPHRAIIEINSLDRPSQPDIVWRNLYKRAKDGRYYFWRQVSVNETVVWDHENTLSSADMGTPLKEGLSAPPTSKFVAFFRGRGYYVATEYPSFVFYSDPGLPEQLSSALQYLDVNSIDGSAITGLYAFGDSMVVFKENSIWQVTALADGSPVLTPIDESIGSLSPRAHIVAYERLVFLGAQGVYQFDGAGIKPLSASLNEWWRNVYQEGLGTATSWLDERERRLFISLQSGPGDVNDMVVCYHYQLDAITMVKGQQITASTKYKGEAILGVRLPVQKTRRPINPKLPSAAEALSGSSTDMSLITGSVRNSDLVIWGLGNSFSYEFAAGGGVDPRDPTHTVSAGSVAGKIRFGPYSANQTGWNSAETMEVAGIDVFVPYTGDHQLTISWYKNRNPVAEGTRTINLNEDGYTGQQKANTDVTPKSGWDSQGKTWGSGTWNGSQQLFQRVTFTDTVVCREIEVEFSNSNSDEPFLIDGFVLWRISKGAEAQR